MLKIQNSENLTIIGISGYATCGKDTFASIAKDILVSKGKKAAVLSFATHLKTIADAVIRPNTGISCISPSPSEKERIRPLLVGIGEGFRAFNEDFWVGFVKDQIEKMLTDEPLVVLIPDCRFLNECRWIKSHKNSYIISLFRDGIFPPNQQESKNIPEIINKITDLSVLWATADNREGILQNETLRSVTTKTLESMSCI